MKRILLILTICLILFLPVWAGAADYYVTQTGAGGETGADCVNAKSIAWFNANASGDDTAIMCDGSFTTTITPANSGSSGHPITYIADTGATVTMTVSGHGFNLDGKDYITIDGVMFGNCSYSWIYLHGSDYCIIKNCNFIGTSGYYAGISFGTDTASTYCQFLDNIFGDFTENNPYDHIMGRKAAHCLFEGNVFGKTGHVNLEFTYSDSQYNIIRNNTFQNEFHTGMNTSTSGGHFLIEGNTFLDMGEDYLNDPTPASARRHNPGIQCNSSANIIRRNEFDQCGSSITLSPNSGTTSANDNRIYNNILNSSVRNQYTSPDVGDTIGGNIWKNNIFSNAFDYAAEVGYNIYLLRGDGTNRYYNNIGYGGTDEYYYQNTHYYSFADLIAGKTTQFPSGNIGANPLFTNEVTRDFTLQQGSSAIDAGTHLAVTTNTGAGATAVVTADDTSWFYDGWGITGEVGDYIYIEDTGKVQILSIDSVTQITLTANATWGTGKKIYYCPDGVCFSGSAPDIGAHEYGGAEQNTAPYGSYTPGGNVTVYGAAPTVSLTSTIVDDESDTISYLWTVPGSDKDGSTDADPGNATFTCGGYPCSRSCSLKVTDEHGAYNTYSFTVTHNETEVTFGDILLWWRCEAFDFSATNGTLDYSAGDDVAAEQSAAAINTDAVKYGTNGMDCPGALDYVIFVVDTDDIIDADEGRIGLWYYRTTQINNSKIVSVTLDANNSFAILIYSNDGLYWEWEDGGTTRTALSIADADLDATTWYFIEAAWKVSTNYRELFVDGVSKGSSSADIGTFAPDTLKIGNISDVANDWFIDNIMISNDSTRDFNTLKNGTQYPGYAKIGSIGTAEQDGTYGIDDSLSNPIFFVDGNGDAKSVTLDDGVNETIESYITVETGDNDLKLAFTALTALSTHWVTTTETEGYKIIAGMVSADLTVVSITIGGDDSIDADVTLPSSPNRLQDNAAIVIDTTATALSIATIALCDSDGVALGVNTANSTVGKIYASITFAGSELGFFNNGPIGDLGMPLALSNGTCVFRYASTQPSGWGVGHNEWLFEGTLEAGDRDDGVECVLAGSAMTRPLGTKIIDGGSNELSDYDWPDTDILSGFTWRVSIPYPSTSPKEFDSTNTMAAWITAGAYPISDDFFKATVANSIGTVDLSAYDGTSGHPMTMDGGGFADDGVQTYGDHYVIKRFIHGSTVVLGLSDIYKYSLISEGSTLRIAATDCEVENDTIKGTFDIDINCTARNVAIPGTVSLANGVTLTAVNCYFSESKATIETTGGTVSDTNCQFSVNNFGFLDEEGGDFRIKGSSVLYQAGFDTGADEDLVGRLTPRGVHDVGPYEVYGGAIIVN